MSSVVNPKKIAVQARKNPQKISEEVEQLLLTDWWELLELTYLSMKHKNSCVFVPRVLAPVSKKEYEKLTTKNQSDFVLTWRCMDKVERDFVNKQAANPIKSIKAPSIDEITKENIKCQLVAPYVFRFNMELYLGFLKECIKNKRMTIIPIGLYDVDHEGHANMMVYDAEKHTLERFEPHGKMSPEEYNPTGLDKTLRKFAKILDKDAIYIPPSQICPVQGPQTVETVTEQIFGTGLQIGSCGIWSLLYADLRLSKPNIAQSTIIKFMTDRIHTHDETILHYIAKVVTMLVALGEKLRIAQTLPETQQAIQEIALWGTQKR